MDSGTTSAELFNFIYLFLDRINMGCMYSDLEFIYLLQQVVSEPPIIDFIEKFFDFENI